MWVPDEESGEPGVGCSGGMRAAAQLLASGDIPHARFAIYVEPTGLAICTAQIGFLIAEIAIRGRSAYFSRPNDGVDALRLGHTMLSELWRLGEELRAREEHPRLGRPQLLVTALNAGGLIAVPGACELSVIRTVTPGESLSRAAEDICRVANDTVKDSDASVTIKFPAGRDHALGGCSAESDPECEEIRALRAAVRAVAPQKDRVAGAPYWSEMSFLNRLDIPCVYWAPGDISMCHTDEESVSIDEFLAGVKALTLFLSESWA
ncbi:M20/M25/M40 family metallo-hydrolase [Streptomyces sp. NPDC048436]|uniref:M20/M25/M40 family metallo-hydrolase n=1 Tax=Streptomyces sp. NPDC048436 TaxID=3365550 RepID=UPI00372241AB